MASYTYTHTTTSVTFTVDGLTEGDQVVFIVRLDPNPGSNLVDAAHGGRFYATGSTMTKTFYVLAVNNTYAINVDVNGSYLGSNSFDTYRGRPNNWEWISVIEKGQPIKIGWQEWNSFCARINAFREYKGLPDYGLFTTVSKGTPISAELVNHAVYAIDAMYSDYMPDVRSGDPITADFFIRLRDRLNNVR